MIFNSEITRMNHPQAKLIPLSIWRLIFNSELTASQMELMQCSPNELKTRLTKLNHLSDRHKRKMFLCCVYRTPVITDSDLYSLSSAIELKPYELLSVAILTGRINFLNKLIELAPERLQDMIQADDFEAFVSAAENGHIDVLNKLIELVAPERLQDMIQANNFIAFCLVAGHGHIAVLNKLIELVAPERLQDMIEAYYFLAFVSAAENGHIAVLNKLIELVAPERLQDMIEVYCFRAFFSAAKNGHIDVLNKLMAFPAMFAYAEIHSNEYGQYVRPFIEKKLEILLGRHTARHPSVVVTQQEALLCFYILRHLMRETPSSEATLSKIDFLMAIPAVKSLLHRPITPGMQNELLREAMRLNNQVLVQRLLAIPAVNEQARRDNFYPEAIRGNLDVRALSDYAESSMMALSPLEEAMIKRLEAKYKPALDKKGVTVAFDEIYDSIMQRYSAKPILFTRANGTSVTLPLTKVEFETLAVTQGFSEAEINDANKLYYQHPIHTLFRYLTTGNPWLHPQASLVVVDTTGNRSADFERYKNLIVLLWTAAADASEPGVDGFTPETRLDEMITQIGRGIGRAHNWDKPQRPVWNADGSPRLDKHGKQRTEQFDDLEADRPSCSSGVRRRLFQSLMGHPLYLQDIRPVIESVFHEKIREAMNAKIQSCVTDSLEAICVEYARMTQGEDMSDTFKHMLPDFDIPLNEIKAWADALHQQYDVAFGYEMVQYSIQCVQDAFFSHAKDLGQFMALAESCQLLPLCTDALHVRTDGFMNELQNDSNKLDFLNEADAWTGQKRIVHAIHLGLLGEVGKHLSPDDFLKLVEETIDIFTIYGNDARLKDWLSSLPEPQQTLLLTEIKASWEKEQAPNPKIDSDSSDSESLQSNHEEATVEEAAHSVTFESLPVDPTGSQLRAFEQNEQRRAASVSSRFREEFSALRDEHQEERPSSPSPRM